MNIKLYSELGYADKAKPVTVVLQGGPLRDQSREVDLGLPYIDLSVDPWYRSWDGKGDDRLARYARTRDGSRIYRFDRMVSSELNNSPLDTFNPVED